MDLDFVEKLIRSMDESSLDSIEIERGGTRIRLAKTPSGSSAPMLYPASPPVAQPSNPAPAAGSTSNPGSSAAGGATATAGGGDDSAPATDSNLVDITSPMVGTFYRSPSPDADAFTEKGERISKGDVLCIIEAMKLMNELEAEVEGTVREVCVENGEPVEYGQVLFRIQPD
ncbi:MAG: acetyl-CoA carboxylase biotin carboxyl carrier protein [Gemmatimonadales bacterium]|nr:MAG: acetyl-CoA carboxylase biotin carboxyl carrier protein [Gemmatimonadales bacterium]